METLDPPTLEVIGTNRRAAARWAIGTVVLWLLALLSWHVVIANFSWCTSDFPPFQQPLRSLPLGLEGLAFPLSALAGFSGMLTGVVALHGFGRSGWSILVPAVLTAGALLALVVYWGVAAPWPPGGNCPHH